MSMQSSNDDEAVAPLGEWDGVVGEALALARGEQPRPASRARLNSVFEQALAKSGRRNGVHAGQRALVFATVCALGCAAVLAIAFIWQSAQGVPAVPEVAANAGAQYQLAGNVLHVKSGKVRVRPHASITVQVGGLEVVLAGAQVLVDASTEGAKISVEWGEAVVRHHGEERRLLSGEHFTESAPAAARPEAPVAGAAPLLEIPDVAVPTARCQGRSDCLSAVAKGASLEAQTALYELALDAYQRRELPRAIGLFDAYQARFPEGVLSPEASVGAMLSREAMGDAAGVEREAARFLERFPNDIRAAAVRALGARQGH